MLARALESVWRQTLQPDVIVIAQDNDRSGAAHTRERGTAAVTTEYVAYLDDDDQLYTNHLELLACEIRDTSADLVYPWFDVDGGRDPFPHHEGLPWRDEEPIQVPVTFIARTAAIRDAGGWTDDWDSTLAEDPGVDLEGNRAGEDWRLVLRMVRNGAKIVHLNRRTWLWYHGANTSGLPSRVDWNLSDW